MSGAVLKFPADPPSLPFRLGYRPWLDGMRGIAVMLVLIFHFGLVRGGFLGVDVFFVLSGFLITSLLVEEWQSTGRIRLGQFYLRRILRLAPALTAVLLGCFLYVWWFEPHRLPAYRSAMLTAACYLSNWPELIPTPMVELVHTWSLSVEEQFYLIWPVILIGLFKLRLGRGWIAAVVVAGIAASAGTRMAIYLHATSISEQIARPIWRMYTGLDTRADSLLVGCLLGLAASWNWIPRGQTAGRVYGILAGVSVPALAYLVWYKPQHFHGHYLGMFTAVALMTAAIVVRMLFAPSRWELRILEWRPLVMLGKISYGLYLIHMPVEIYLNLKMDPQHPGNVLLVAAICLILAVASFYGIERPFLQLKNRFRAPCEKTPLHETRRAA